MSSAPRDLARHGVAGADDLLLAFLDDSRAELVGAVVGLADGQARQRLVPSLTSPLSVLRHLVFVEQVWFHSLVQGRPRAEVCLVEDAEDSWVLSEDDTVEGLLELFGRVCQRSREIMVGRDLDEVVTHRRMGELTLRFVVVHVIREHARHAGHVDVLREQIEA